MWLFGVKVGLLGRNGRFIICGWLHCFGGFGSGVRSG
jgi:hypothetical protein